MIKIAPMNVNAARPAFKKNTALQLALGGLSGIYSKCIIWEETHAVYSVMRAPQTKANPLPTGFPPEKIANAIVRVNDGGNEWAKMPIYRPTRFVPEIFQRIINRLTAAGIIAARPIPCIPRRKNIWNCVFANPHPRQKTPAHKLPIRNTFLRP